MKNLDEFFEIDSINWNGLIEKETSVDYVMGISDRLYKENLSVTEITYFDILIHQKIYNLILKR